MRKVIVGVFMSLDVSCRHRAEPDEDDTFGAGKRLSGAGVPAGACTLIEHRLTSGGRVMATYEPEGPLKTGSFAMTEPSAAERVRRTRIESERLMTRRSFGETHERGLANSRSTPI